MKISIFVAAALSGAAVLACASKPTPVTVSGDSGGRASLAGKWTGEYQSTATGRSGSIVFNLSPAGDAATGDVVMIPRGYGKALVPYAEPGTGAGAVGSTPTPTTNPQPATVSQVLTIRLVRVAGDSVSGVLDSYRDPECNCPVQTTFDGTMNGDTIEGTFTTRGRQSNAPQTGTWRVKRGR
jgi:hypothetical protein